MRGERSGSGGGSGGVERPRGCGGSTWERRQASSLACAGMMARAAGLGASADGACRLIQRLLSHVTCRLGSTLDAVDMLSSALRQGHSPNA